MEEKSHTHAMLPVVATAIFTGIGTLMLSLVFGVGEEVTNLRGRVNDVELAADTRQRLRALEVQQAENTAAANLLEERMDRVVGEVIRIREGLYSDRCGDQ